MIAGITEKEQKIIEHILDKYRKDYAFFYYGSRVKGTYEKTSDLDVLIKGKAEMPLAILQEIKEEFDKSDLPYIVNFSDYYKLDSSFYERIKPDLIPYNWQEVKLGDMCRFQNGYAFKSSQFTNNGNIKIIKIKEIKEGKIIFFDDSASVFYNDKYKKYQVENDDILVALTGDPVARPNPASWVGRIAIFKGSEKALINQRVAKFLPNKTVLFPLFIYYFFRDFNNFYNLAKQATGSASQANISTDMLENTEILLPPLDVQKKIAGVLGALDDKIELNNKINQNLEAQAQALFKSWFVDFEPFGSKMPSDWKIGNLLDIATYLNGLAMQKFRPKNNEKSLPVLKIKELRQGFCDSSSERCTASVKQDYIIKDGDIIFSWSGSLLVDLWCGGDCGLNQHLFKVSSSNYNKWFYYMWTKHYLDKFSFIAADKATTMGHIKREDLERAKVILPSTQDYKKMNNIQEPLLDKIIANRIQNRKITELRDTLLPKLMSGEISVDDVKID